MNLLLHVISDAESGHPLPSDGRGWPKVPAPEIIAQEISDDLEAVLE